MYYPNNYQQQGNIAQMQQEYLNLNSRFQNAQKESEYYRGLYEELKRKTLSSFAPLLSNNYNISQLGGNTVDFSDPLALIDYVVNDVTQSKTEYIEKTRQIVAFKENAEINIKAFKTEIERLTIENEKQISQLKDYQKSVEEKQNEISQLRQENIRFKKQEEIKNNNEKTDSEKDEEIKRLKQEIELLRNKAEESKKKVETPKIPEKREEVPEKTEEKIKEPKVSIENKQEKKPVENKSIPQKAEKIPQAVRPARPSPVIPGKSVIKASSKKNEEETIPIEKIETGKADEDRNNIVANLVPSEVELIKIIGKYGISRNADIKYLYEENPDIKGTLGNDRDNGVVNSLANKGLLQSEPCRIAGIPHNVYEFTNAGKDVYRILFSEEAVESQKNTLSKEHDNMIHGFLILDVSRKLKENYNAITVKTDRSEIAVKLNNGKTYIPDIIADIKFAEHSKTSRCYFEVELGTTKESEFFEKCDKMKKVTDTFYFVSDSDKNLGASRSKVDKWIMKQGGRENVKNLKIYYITYKNVRDGMPFEEMEKVFF